MLYITTRSEERTFPGSYVLEHSRGEEGGMFVPYQLPAMSPEDWKQLLGQSFGACGAQVLNLLLGTRLTAWDVEFCTGRHPVRVRQIGQRLFAGECWHNPQWHFQSTLDKLMQYIGAKELKPGNWPGIAVRMAMLAGICGELQKQGIHQWDVAMVSGDLAMASACLYARQWGMPVGNIILCCNENKQLWDLICHGQMRTDSLSADCAVPEGNLCLPCHLERLLYFCGGTEEVFRYEQAARKGGLYTLREDRRAKLREGICVSVAGSQRVEQTIPRAFATHGYLHSMESALAYAGLQDYRVVSGNTGCGLILSEKGPAFDPEAVARAMGIPEKELERYL